MPDQPDLLDDNDELALRLLMEKLGLRPSECPFLHEENGTWEPPRYRQMDLEEEHDHGRDIKEWRYVNVLDLTAPEGSQQKIMKISSVAEAELETKFNPARYRTMDLDEE